LAPGNGGNELAIDNIEVNDNSTVGTFETTTFEFVKVQPNPVGNGQPLTLTFSLKNREALTAEIIDITGKVQKVVSRNHFEAGVSTFEIDRSGLSRGVYFVRLRAGENTTVVKAVLR
jgi:hypothetical protein